MIGPLRARVALDDASLAATLFGSASDASSRRVHWIATITLLRAVGHVLSNVDRDQDPIVAAAIDEHWTAVSQVERKRHGIFFDFIAPERNSSLKTYRFAYEDVENEGVVAAQLSAYREPDLIVMPALTEGYDGADVRELIREAIDWWDGQLARIEQLISDGWQRQRALEAGSGDRPA